MIHFERHEIKQISQSKHCCQIKTIQSRDTQKYNSQPSFTY